MIPKPIAPRFWGGGVSYRYTRNDGQSGESRSVDGWVHTGCYGGKQYYPYVTSIRIFTPSVFEVEITREYFRPLLALDWGMSDRDDHKYEFEWDFTQPNTRPKMFAFACLARYANLHYQAFIDWFRLREFMSDDEAYLVCLHSGVHGAGKFGSSYFIPTLAHLRYLKGFKLQHIIDIADTGVYHKTNQMMFSLIDQLPQFESYNFTNQNILGDGNQMENVSKRYDVEGRFNDYRFTPAIYNWVDKNGPITSDNYKEFKAVIVAKETKPSYESVTVGSL